MSSHAHCDSSTSLPAETTAASSLTPNTFYKLCPARHGDNDHNVPLGHNPQCGDGTPFNFFFSRPPSRYADSRSSKLLIELQGGGACWDGDTCGMQSDYLTWPTVYDAFIGESCSEIEYGVVSNNNNNNNSPISMLCAKSIGATDFREYSTVVVPYCTQDVHIGDSIQTYSNGDSDDTSMTVRHAGAHNLLSVLRWIYANFPDPTHIVITGCSAGGTAAPVVYDLLHAHYSSVLRGGIIGGSGVNINVVMDSSVYLTPEAFLNNYYGNWGPERIMKKIRFNFNKYRYESNYPDLLWQHILRRGSNSDRWGFVTHSKDPISLMYYQYMSGNGNNNNNGRSLSSSLSQSSNNTHTINTNRNLEDNNNLQTEWWNGIVTSMNAVQKKHDKNVFFYTIDGEGHCSFGLYYPLQDEGFESWASPIVKEGRVIGNHRPSVVSFMISFALGGACLMAAIAAARQKNESKLLDEETSDSNNHHRANRLSSSMLRLKGIAILHASRYSSYPWTASYLFTISLYFILMLIIQGFAHPLDNPTLGPSAVGLSSFGINNPSLIIYQMEHYRLFTSTFVCSGVITFLPVFFSMYKYGAALESAMMENKHPHWVFAIVAAIISLGVNLMYACVGNGASGTSLSLVIGLNVFCGILKRRSDTSSAYTPYNKPYISSWGFTLFVALIGCTPLFPFDSPVTILAAIVIGTVLGLFLFQNTLLGSTEGKSGYTVRWNIVRGTGVLFFVMYLLVLLGVPSPEIRNIHPYLTGCNLVYSDQIGDFVEQYAGNYRGRMLEGNDDLFGGQNMCAQLCVPHLVHRPLVWGANKLGLIAIEEGTCEENGYDEHIADKAIREYTITIEVELYTQSDEE